MTLGNNQRILNVNAIHKTLGEKLCSALPGFHAITGCDYIPAFFGKGKNRPWKLLQDNEDIQEAFCKLHTSYEDEVTLSTIEKFVVKLYAKSK